jgi:hypothetical protein
VRNVGGAGDVTQRPAGERLGEATGELLGDRGLLRTDSVADELGVRPGALRDVVARAGEVSATGSHADTLDAAATSQSDLADGALTHHTGSEHTFDTAGQVLPAADLDTTSPEGPTVHDPDDREDPTGAATASVDAVEVAAVQYALEQERAAARREAKIASYGPRRHVGKKQWKRIRDTVRDAVRRGGSYKLADGPMHYATRFVAWCDDQGFELVADDLFIPGRIDEYIDGHLKRAGAGTDRRGTPRSVLRSIGRSLNPDLDFSGAPAAIAEGYRPQRKRIREFNKHLREFERRLAEANAALAAQVGEAEFERKVISVAETIYLPPADKISGSAYLPPYTDDEVARMIAQALAQRTAARRRKFMSCLCLMLGAGLEPREAIHVRPEQVWASDGRAFVEVTGGVNPRIMPLRRRFGHLLLTAAAETPAHELLLGGQNPDRTNVTHQIFKDLDGKQYAPEPAASRMRTTYVVWLLHQHVPYHVVLKLTGLKSVRALDEYVAHLEPADDIELAATLDMIDRDPTSPPMCGRTTPPPTDASDDGPVDAASGADDPTTRHPERSGRHDPEQVRPRAAVESLELAERLVDASGVVAEIEALLDPAKGRPRQLQVRTYLVGLALTALHSDTKPTADRVHTRLAELGVDDQRRLGFLRNDGTPLTRSAPKRLTATISAAFAEQAADTGAPSTLAWLRDQLLAAATTDAAEAVPATDVERDGVAGTAARQAQEAAG